MNEPLTQLAIQAAGNEASDLSAIDGGAPEEREAIAVFGGDTEHVPARRSVFVQPTPGRLPLPAVPARPGVPAVYLGIGALAGMAVSLVLFNVLAPVKTVRTTVVVHELPAPRSVSSLADARHTAPVHALVPMDASALPAFVVKPEARLPTVRIFAPRATGAPPAAKPQGQQGVAGLSSPPAPTAAAARNRKPQREVIPATPIGRAPAPPAAAPPVFSASTVLYQAPSTPAPPPPSAAVVMPQPAPHAASTPGRATYTVISVPSRDIALVESTVQGRAMVSPYKVGQSLPDGKVIIAMDPGAGELRTSGGTLRSQPEQ